MIKYTFKFGKMKRLPEEGQRIYISSPYNREGKWSTRGGGIVAWGDGSYTKLETLHYANCTWSPVN